MKRIEYSMLIGIIIAVCVSSVTGFGAQCEEMRSNMLRLHILANSDSEDDQNLKYRVRDAVLVQSAAMTGTVSITAAEESIAGSLEEIEAIAQKEILDAGYDYSVKAKLVNMYFSTRRYEKITVPAGRYDAVRIIIGEGNGENWWCVMFPPMCVPAALEKEAGMLEEQIESLGTEPKYKAKFAVVEVIEAVKNKLSGESEEVIAEVSDDIPPEKT